jgi:hypothetical protein
MILDRGAQAVVRGGARCASQDFIEVLRPMPAAVASRCCRHRSQQLACACAATLSQQEKNGSSVVQRSRMIVALTVQQPLTLAAINLLRVGVVDSVFAAALTV